MNEIKLADASPGLSLDQPWFVAQLKPNAEAIAKRNLLQQGIRFFAPFEEGTARKARKLVQVRKALFPGYLFVSFDQDVARWRAVNSTMGICKLVSFAENRPAQVPLGIISSLMRRCDSSGKLLPLRYLQSDDAVRVTNGPFADFIGTVEQIASNQRIWVLLDILGKNTRVAIRSADLRLAG
jgi:transcriptional antiterminator RfaH